MRSVTFDVWTSYYEVYYTHVVLCPAYDAEHCIEISNKGKVIHLLIDRSSRIYKFWIEISDNKMHLIGLQQVIQTHLIHWVCDVTHRLCKSICT